MPTGVVNLDEVVDLDALDFADVVDLDALEGPAGWEQYMGPAEFFGVQQVRPTGEPSEADLNPDTYSGRTSLGDLPIAIAQATSKPFEVLNMPLDWVARKVGGPGLGNTTQEMYQNLVAGDPTAPKFFGGQYESVLDTRPARILGGVAKQAGALALDWTNVLPLKWGRAAVVFLPGMAHGFGDVVGRAIAARDQGKDKEADVLFGEAAAQGLAMGLFTKGAASDLAAGKVDSAVKEINAKAPSPMENPPEAIKGQMTLPGFRPQNEAAPPPLPPIEQLVLDFDAPEQLPLDFNPPKEMPKPARLKKGKATRAPVDEVDAALLTIAPRLDKKGEPNKRTFLVGKGNETEVLNSGGWNPKLEVGSQAIADLPYSGREIAKAIRKGGDDPIYLEVKEALRQEMEARRGEVVDLDEVGDRSAQRADDFPAEPPGVTARLGGQFWQQVEEVTRKLDPENLRDYPTRDVDGVTEIEVPKGELESYGAPRHPGLREAVDYLEGKPSGVRTLEEGAFRAPKSEAENFILDLYNEGLNQLVSDPRVIQLLPEDSLRQLQETYSSRAAGVIDRTKVYAENLPSKSAPSGGEIVINPYELSQAYLDARHQGKGFFRAAVDQFIDNIYHEISHVNDRLHTPDEYASGVGFTGFSIAPWEQIKFDNLYNSIKQLDPLKDLREQLLRGYDTPKREGADLGRPLGEKFYRAMEALHDAPQTKPVDDILSLITPEEEAALIKELSGEQKSLPFDEEVPPQPEVTEMNAGPRITKEDLLKIDRFGTLSLATSFGTTLHNLANLGIVMPFNAITNAGVAAGSKLAQGIHLLRGDLAGAARSAERARQYMAISARYPIAAISSAAASMAEGIRLLPLLGKVGTKLGSYTNAPEMAQFEAFLERTGQKQAAARLKGFSHPDLAAKNPLEKTMLYFSALADRFAIHTMMDSYAEGLKTKYGVGTLAELENLYKTGSDATRRNLERDFAVMETNAARTAFNLPASKRGLVANFSFPQKIVQWMSTVPLARLSILPFGNALFGNAIPGALELFPLVNKLSARYRNSMEYHQVEANRSQMIQAHMNNGLSYGKALKQKDVRALNKRMSTLQRDGIYAPEELYMRSAIGPLMIAAATAWRVSQGDDGTEWDELKDKDGKVTSIRPSLGYFAPYVLLGDRIGHMIKKTGKYAQQEGEWSNLHKEMLGAVTGSRGANVLGPGGELALKALTGDIASEESGKALLKRVVSDMSRALTSVGWLGDVTKNIYEAKTGTEEMSRNVRTDVGSVGDSFWAGMAQNYPWSRKSLPGQIDWMAGKVGEVETSMGQRWKERSVLEEEFNRVKGLVDAREFLPSRTQDPEFDQMVLKNFMELRQANQTDEYLQSLSSPREKAEFLRKWMGGLRDAAKEWGLREYVAKHGRLPEGMERGEREKLIRKEAFPRPGPPQPPRMNRAPFIDLDEPVSLDE